jgi:hypothetical protein
MFILIDWSKTMLRAYRQSQIPQVTVCPDVSCGQYVTVCPDSIKSNDLDSFVDSVLSAARFEVANTIIVKSRQN